MQQMCVTGHSECNIKQTYYITTPKSSFIMIRSGKNSVPIIILQTFLSNTRVHITNKYTNKNSPKLWKTSLKKIKL